MTNAFEEVAAELEAVIDGDPVERMRVLTGNSITILAALKTAAGQMSAWQPISTAPTQPAASLPAKPISA